MIKLTVDGMKSSTSEYLVKRISESNNKDKKCYKLDLEKPYLKEEIKNEIKNMELSDTNYIIDGGPLEQMVKQITKRIIPTFQVNLVEKRPTVKYDWLPITLKDLADYYKSSYVNVIFYLSDTETYIENIEKNTEKVMPLKEKRDIKVKNYLYKHIIESLLIYAPELKDKIILEDISTMESRARFAHYIRVMLS